MRPLVLILTLIASVGAAETPTRDGVATLIRSAEEWLLAQQQPDGSFLQAPRFVLGVSELSLEALRLEPASLAIDDPRTARSISFIRGHIQADGGIYQPAEGLAVYGTGIGLLSLGAARNLDAPTAARARDFLFTLQNLQPRSGGYGGIGYDGPGAEDLHNTATAIEALRAAGVPAADPRLQAALHFLQMCQDLSQPPAGVPKPAIAELPAPPDGKYGWRTWTRNTGGAVSRPSAADPQAMREGGGEDRDDSRPPEAYSTMTYALISSFIALEVGPGDPRVVAALGWVRRNWRLDANPGMPAGHEQDGLYYSYAIMARALDLAGVSTLELADGRRIDWRSDLAAELMRTVKRDEAGRAWWVNTSRRWGEAVPQLATVYALSALKRIHAGMAR